MKNVTFRRLTLGILVASLSACANPFADGSSTKGPSPTVTPGVGRATVTWNPVLGASGYRLEWSPSADFAGATVVEPALSPVDVDALAPGNTYSFRIRAQLKSGPSSWATANLPVSGWTWAPPPETVDTRTIIDNRTISLPGVSIPVTTTYTVTTVKHETLKYASSGLTRSTFLRATTTFADVSGSTSVDTTPVVVTGSWDPGQLWQSMTLGSTVYALANLAGDRKTFILGSDPVTWTLTP